MLCHYFYATLHKLSHCVFVTFLFLGISPEQNYAILEQLGEGGYAQAFRARNLLTNATVIVKFYRFKKLKIYKIMREIMITQSLCESNRVSKLVDIFLEAATQRPALVFEYTQSDSHEKLFPILQPDDIQRYAYQLLEGLAYAHSQGVVHKDIHPGNIVIDHSTKQLKIIDWSLSRFLYKGMHTSMFWSTKRFKCLSLLSFHRQLGFHQCTPHFT